MGPDTIYYDGNPVQSGTSWSNLGHINLALHHASMIHQAGLIDNKGDRDLVSILIITPYARATRDLRAAFKRCLIGTYAKRELRSRLLTDLKVTSLMLPLPLTLWGRVVVSCRKRIVQWLQ